MMPKSTSAKNGQRRVITNRDNIRHIEYFMNGQWRHSAGCRVYKQGLYSDKFVIN
jgi:hypothetical protein